MYIASGTMDLGRAMVSKIRLNEAVHFFRQTLPPIRFRPAGQFLYPAGRYSPVVKKLVVRHNHPRKIARVQLSVAVMTEPEEVRIARRHLIAGFQRAPDFGGIPQN